MHRRQLQAALIAAKAPPPPPPPPPRSPPPRTTFKGGGPGRVQSMSIYQQYGLCRSSGVWLLINALMVQKIATAGLFIVGHSSRAGSNLPGMLHAVVTQCKDRSAVCSLASQRPGQGAGQDGEGAPSLEQPGTLRAAPLQLLGTKATLEM